MLKISKERELQEITALVAEICNAPIVLITVYNEGSSHLRFIEGTDKISKNRIEQLCDFANHQNLSLIISDTLKSTYFKGSPLINGKNNIRFYAGLPLITKDGYHLGNLCVVDSSPKNLDQAQIKILHILVKQATQLLEFADSLEILKNQFTDAKNSLNTLRSFFDASHSSYVFIGKNMEIIAFNKVLKVAVKALFDKEVVLGASVLDYVSENDKVDFKKHFQLSLGGESVKIDKEVRGNNLTSWWHMTYDPAKDEDGNIIGVSFNASDISGRVKQKEEIDNQSLTLKQIAWMQSHELRRPVSSILGLMEIIKEEGYSASKEILLKMESATLELDNKIKMIIQQA